MVKKISFKASKLIYIEIQNAEAVQCYQIFFFFFFLCVNIGLFCRICRYLAGSSQTAEKMKLQPNVF